MLLPTERELAEEAQQKAEGSTTGKPRKPKKKPNDWRLNSGNWGLIPKVSNFLWADFGKTPPVEYFIFESAFSPMENEELTTVPIYCASRLAAFRGLKLT
jgi:hypothetical protein